MDEIRMINETQIEADEQVIYTALDAFVDIVIFLVILTCALIIFTISINKRLQTRTYWLLLNWSANEILFLVFTALREVSHLFFSGCVKVHLDILFPTISTILMLMMISNVFMNGRYSFKIVLGATYAALVLLFTGLCILCESQGTLLPAFLFYVAVNLTLLIITFIKECNKCLKSTALKGKTLFRLNLARIFIYNCTIIIFFYVLFHKDVLSNQFVRQLAMASFLLTPVYFLIYIMCADNNFKIAFLNVFRKSENRERLDVDFNLTDDYDISSSV